MNEWDMRMINIMYFETKKISKSRTHGFLKKFANLDSKYYVIPLWTEFHRDGLGMDKILPSQILRLQVCHAQAAAATHSGLIASYIICS